MPEILNKKQLEDAAECGTDKPCSKCNCRDIRKRNPVCKCVSEVAQTALAYREMLERIEWCCLTDYGIGRAPTCPFCGNVKSKGHKPFCEWVVAMKGKRG